MDALATNPNCASQARTGPDVQFLRRCKRPASFAPGHQLAVCCLLVSIPLGVAHRIQLVTGGVMARPWSCLLFAPLGVWFILRLIALARREWSIMHNTGAEVTAGVRLAYVGAAEDLVPFGGFHDCGFDPVLFRVAAGQPCLPHMPGTRVVYTILAVLAAYFLLVFLLGLPGPVYPLERLSPAHGLAMGLGASGGFILADWLCAAYIRIVPGRLDVMRFSVLRGRLNAVVHVSLRGARIVVDRRRDLVFIDRAAEGEGGSIELSMRYMREKTAFAYSLFLAAMSTSNPPALPDDQLTG